jgi:hypothetical protein
MLVLLLAACSPVDDPDDLMSVPGPELRVYPEVFDFEVVLPGDEYRINGFVYNEGEVPLGVRSDGFADTSAFAGWLEPGNATGPNDEDLELDPDRPVLPPGAQMPFTLLFRPLEGGWFADDLRIETYGDGVNDFPDLRRSEFLVLAEGQSPGGAAYAPWPSVPARVTGEPAGTAAFAPVTNRGSAPFRVMGVSAECGGGAWLVERSYPVTVEAGESLPIEVGYPTGAAGASCQLEIETDVTALEWPLTTDVAVASACSSNTSPEVVIVSPAEAFRIEAVGDTVTFELRLADAQDDASALGCSVSVGGSTVASCAAPGPGRFSVDVPIPSASAGTTDTVSFAVTDSCGARTRVGIPVVFGAWPSGDGDGDGYESPEDCDDEDAGAFPGAGEAVDGQDDDCDGRADEGTDAYDDDGDALTEAEGDCDDANGDVYPGSPELHDSLDNDCDGVLDEGTRGWDDDGDGWAEIQGDCDDAEPAVAPPATEMCANEIDDDCNGLKDAQETCAGALVPLSLTPVQVSQTTAAPGEQITARVLALGAAESIVWDATGGVFDARTGEEALWTPDRPGEYLLTVTATAADGSVVSATETVRVTSDGFAVTIPEQDVSAGRVTR